MKRGETPLRKEKVLARFLARLAATTIDMGLWLFIGSELTYLLRLLIGNVPYLEVGAILLAFAAYYIFLERYFGRTPGKWLAGLNIMSARGDAAPSSQSRTDALALSPPTKNQLLARTFARLLGPMGFLMWNRVSIIDLLSGTGVYSTYQFSKCKKQLKKEAMEKEKPKGGWR